MLRTNFDGVLMSGIMPWCGRWNSHSWIRVIILIWVLNRMSSKICGIWYLCMFFLRDGPLSLYIYWLFDGSSKVLVLLSYHAKVIYSCAVICDVTVVMYEGLGLQMFPKPLQNLTKNCCKFTNISILIHLCLYITPFCGDRISFFGSHQEVFDGHPSEVHLNLSLKPLV